MCVCVCYLNILKSYAARRMTYPQMRIWIPSLRFGSGVVARYASGSGYESFVGATECRSVNVEKSNKAMRVCYGSTLWLSSWAGEVLGRCTRKPRKSWLSYPVTFHGLNQILEYKNVRDIPIYMFYSFFCLCMYLYIQNRIHVVRRKILSITLDASLHDRVDHSMRNIWTCITCITNIKLYEVKQYPCASIVLYNIYATSDTLVTALRINGYCHGCSQSDFKVWDLNKVLNRISQT